MSCPLVRPVVRHIDCIGGQIDTATAAVEGRPASTRRRAASGDIAVEFGNHIGKVERQSDTDACDAIDEADGAGIGRLLGLAGRIDVDVAMPRNDGRGGPDLGQRIEIGVGNRNGDGGGVGIDRGRQHIGRSARHRLGADIAARGDAGIIFRR